MTLHKQVKKKKQYETNYTLIPGCRDKFLIHPDEKEDCWRVTFYSQFSEGKHDTTLSTVTGKKHPKTGQMGWMRRSWTYQKKFKHEVEAMDFAKGKATQRGMSNPVFLLQLDITVPEPPTLDNGLPF